MKRVAQLLLSFCFFSIPAHAQSDSTSHTIQFPVEELRWTDAPPSAPTGSKMIVLEGSPASDELYTVRLKVPAGTKLPPHTHPKDERVTVLSGEARVGFGEVFDEKNMTRFRAGSYYVNPSGIVHFVWFPVETVIQLTGFGPWRTEYRE